MTEIQSFVDGRVALHHGDCLASIKMLADNSIDACVTDPPYALVSIVKRFGKTSLADLNNTSDRARKAADPYARAGRGFMGKDWDNGSTAFAVEFWREILRVMKPGAHIVAFGGTRTYHRLAVAIEDAGFEIRDMIAWQYGTGFPKSHDIAFEFEKRLCVARKVGQTTKWFYLSDGVELDRDNLRDPDAIEWRGRGTALKPALEPICLARKPLSERTVAANVLRWRTGAINIDACRIEGVDQEALAANWDRATITDIRGGNFMAGKAAALPNTRSAPTGRWPANIVHDGSPEVLAAFPESTSGALTPEHQANAGYSSDSPCHHGGSARGGSGTYQANSGSAARFFYSAKADKDDRLGSKHPTVKPVDLMQWLCRLITPPGGTILDPFAGTGTTGEAAWREGFGAVLIEREPESCADIARRMALALAGPMERKHESIKAAGRQVDPLPLFGEAA